MELCNCVGGKKKLSHLLICLSVNMKSFFPLHLGNCSLSPLVFIRLLKSDGDLERSVQSGWPSLAEVTVQDFKGRKWFVHPGKNAAKPISKQHFLQSNPNLQHGKDE